MKIVEVFANILLAVVLVSTCAPPLNGGNPMAVLLHKAYRRHGLPIECVGALNCVLIHDTF